MVKDFFVKVLARSLSFALEYTLSVNEVYEAKLASSEQSNHCKGFTRSYDHMVK